MAKTRYAPGFVVDSNLPGVARPANINPDISPAAFATTTTHNTGTSPATGVTVSEAGTGLLHQTTLTLTAVSVTMVDAGAAGSHGSVQLYDFPAGLIGHLGATMSLTLTAGAGGVADGAAAVAALGTAALATDNATLAGAGEANLLPSTAFTLVGGVKANTSVSTTALIALVNGTATPVDVYLNIAVPDADSSADDTFSVTGTVTLTWAFLGDV